MPSRAGRAAEAVRSRARFAPLKPVEAEALRVRFVPPRNSRRWMKKKPSSRKARRKETKSRKHPSRSPGKAAEAERKDSAVGTQRQKAGPQRLCLFTSGQAMTDLSFRQGQGARSGYSPDYPPVSRKSVPHRCSIKDPAAPRVCRQSRPAGPSPAGSADATPR